MRMLDRMLLGSNFKQEKDEEESFLWWLEEKSCRYSVYTIFLCFGKEIYLCGQKLEDHDVLYLIHHCRC